jgi:alpha-aminoadipic semialdehyde synthase
MKMLDVFLERNVRLIDYECMVNDRNKRVVGFGLFAGTAGMIDLLRGLGDRMLGLGYTNPFLGLGYSGMLALPSSEPASGKGLVELATFTAPTTLSHPCPFLSSLPCSFFSSLLPRPDYYHSVSAAKTAVQLVGSNIQINGVPRDLAPAIFGFTGP